MIYLGAQRVGVSHGSGGSAPIDGTVISDEKMAELQDAVAYRVGDYDDTRDVDEIIEELNKPYSRNIHSELSAFYDESWTRPQGWPDLDSIAPEITANTPDYIFMTYDTRDSLGGIALHVEKVTNGTNIEVAMGHISNGEYVVDETITGTSNNYVRWFTGEEPDYVVVRVTGTIKVCYLYSVKNSENATLFFRKQPVLERIAYVPNLTTFCTGYTTNAWSSMIMQRDKVSNGNGDALTSLYYAWAYTRNLLSLDISGLRTPHVTNMNATFYTGLLKIKSLDLTHLDVSKVTNFNSTFAGCRGIQVLNLTGWNTSSATGMANMFDTCYSLKTINGLENFNPANVTAMNLMFNSDYSLTSLDLSSWRPTKLTNMASMFSGCRSVVEINLSNWNTLVSNLSSTFNSCYALKQLNLTNFTHGVLTTISSIFSNCWSLQKLDLSWLNITAACSNIYSAFNACWALEEINLNTWDVSGIGDANNTANSVFYNCQNVTKITGIKNWNFQFSNSLTSMFYNCYSLREVDVSGWNVSTVTSISSMFQNCYSLKSVDLSNWNPKKSTSFSSMFKACVSLTSVGNLNNWNTSSVKTIDGMFYECLSLKSVPDITKWDLTQVTNMSGMFQSCHSVKEMRFPNLDLPLCTNIQTTMRYCYNLEVVDLSNWNVPVAAYNASSYMQAADCWSLREVIGITVPSSYARIGFSNDANLSHDSVLRILNALPTVTGTHTVYLTSENVQGLTADEKAIATNKGWTIAN